MTAGEREEEPLPRLATEVRADPARSIIARNRSPDINFDQSINPYRGCGARVRLLLRPPEPRLAGSLPRTRLRDQTVLQGERRRAARKGALPSRIPAELHCTRLQHRSLPADRTQAPGHPKHPRSARSLPSPGGHRHQERIDRARSRRARFDGEARSRERDRQRHHPGRRTEAHPRAAHLFAPPPARGGARLEGCGRSGRGPGRARHPLHQRRRIEDILSASREAGAAVAHHTLIRLPHELKDLFREWLDSHFPERAEHVMSIIRQCRGGRDNDPRFGHRMRGTGVYADLIARRFATARRRLGFDRKLPSSDCTRFVAPVPASRQRSLFDPAPV